MKGEGKKIADIGEIRRRVEKTKAEKTVEYDLKDRDKADPHFTSEETLTALRSNEDGDAWLYIEIHHVRLAYDHSEGQWYQFHGPYWQKDVTDKATAATEGVIKAYGKETGTQSQKRLKAERAGNVSKAEEHEETEDALCKRIRALQSAKRKDNILKLASIDWSDQNRKTLALTGNEWDQNPMVLCCSNGVIDLETGDFRQCQPEEYLRTYAPTEWHGMDTPAPRWDRSLVEIFDGKKDIIDYVQRLFGYGITGRTTEHNITIFYGPGRNGKGTLLETVNQVLGGFAGPVEAEMLLIHRQVRQSGGPTSDIMALRGKRLVWASETEEGRSINAGKLKWFTGGDTLTGREPYGRRQVNFRPTHKVLLLTNHKPRAPANDYALWKRMHLIPFPLSFVDNPEKENERKSDPNLFEELKTESSGILAWLVRGCLEWQRQGLNPPGIVQAATQDYQKEEDIIGRFIDECCETIQDAKVKAGEIYNAYKEWAEENGLKPVISGRRFADQMCTRFRRDDTGRHRFYLDIELAKDGH